MYFCKTLQNSKDVTHKMITIIGPTACGKTALAASLAAHFIKNGQPAEIISGDSRQVYRGMDLGTGKDLCEYTVGDIEVPYHLIDICDPGYKYNIFEYQQDFLKAYNDCTSRSVLPILCGGSGLYVESIVRGYNLSPVPQNDTLRKELEHKSLAELTQILTDLKKQSNTSLHNTTDVDSAQRAIRAIEIETYNLEHPTENRKFPPVESIVIGIDVPREVRRNRISSRLKARVDNGMIDEIKQLLNSGLEPQSLIYYGLEYKYVTEYVIGELSYEEMLRQLEIAIHQFAKRQMTWFRGMEKRGVCINWIDGTMTEQDKINRILEITATS